MADVIDAAAVVVGSPTLNRGMFPTVAGFLCYMTGLKPQRRIGGAFGSYGWSGEAVGEIEAILEKAKFSSNSYSPDPITAANCSWARSY